MLFVVHGPIDYKTLQGKKLDALRVFVTESVHGTHVYTVHTVYLLQKAN